MRAPVTSVCGGKSSADASTPRHDVRRDHDRSESPGVYPVRRMNTASASGSASESVMRRCAIWPIGVAAGTCGGRDGHHATTGVSGSSRGVTIASGWAPTSPSMCMTTTSAAPASPPRRNSASRRFSPRGSPDTSTSTRAGCSRDTALTVATMFSMSSSRWARTMSVSTRPVVTMPPVSRRVTSLRAMSRVSVSGKSMIIGT